VAKHERGQELILPPRRSLKEKRFLINTFPERAVNLQRHYAPMRIIHIFLVLVILLARIPLFAQVTNVSIAVSFDSFVSSTNNDYANNFTTAWSPNPFTQVTTGGITGGALEPQNYGSWGNSVARFKYMFANATGQVLKTSIDFKYNQLLVNTSQPDRAVALSLSPSADGNHYMIFFVWPSGNLEISAYANSWSGGTWGSLTNGWYQLLTTITNIGGQFGNALAVRLEMFSLGASGTATPASVGVVKGTNYDLVFATDQKISVNIYGTQWGGSALLDNFFFAGPTVQPPHIPCQIATAATATAILTNGFVVAITLTDAGCGYTNAPLVQIVGGGGSGAQAVALVSNGVVTVVNVLNAGSGYTNPPLVVVEPPFIPHPVLSIAPMSFLAFSNLTLGGVYQLQRSVAGSWSNQPASFTATNALCTQMVAGVAGSRDYRLVSSPAPA
jgi:hypothetical protein